MSDKTPLSIDCKKHNPSGYVSLSSVGDGICQECLRNRKMGFKDTIIMILLIPVVLIFYIACLLTGNLKDSK